jgi:hypothetical protein
MSKTTLLTLGALVAAAILAAGREGSVRMGIVGGALLGAALGLLAYLWLRHAVMHRPERAMQANLLGFLILLGGLMLGFLSLYAVPAAGAALELKAFILTYVALAFIPLVLGSVECAQSLKSPALPGGTSS